jgi:cation:H+ antiporter
MKEVLLYVDNMGEEKVEHGVIALLQWNTLIITIALTITLAFLDTLSTGMGWKSVSILLVLIAVAIALLITSANFFIEGAKGLARRAGIAEVVIGLTIVSIGTSLPEILVTSTAAKESVNDPALLDLAIGNIYGSILVQITLILGIVVVFRPFKIRPNWLRRDGLLMLAAVLLMSLLLYQGSGLSRIEGMILCLIYFAYIFWLLNNRERIREDELPMIEDQSNEFSWTSTAYLTMVALGLGMALYAAFQLVDHASQIAIMLNVPHAIVGTTMSGLGTSLPELTVALMAAKRSQGVAIGTLVGSNITDPLLSIGIASIVTPLTITPESYNLIIYLIMPSTILGISFCLVMMWTDFKFQRWEGGFLIGFYMFFLVLLELQRRGYLSL